jgi:hypothetical protein
MRTGKPVKRGRGGSRATIDPLTTGTMAYTDYLRASLEQLEQATLDASEAGSWQAVGSLKLRALEVRKALDEEIAKASSPDDSMSDEQLLAIIVQAVASMPAQHLERIEDAVEMRRGGKVLRLAGGGA